MIRIEEDETNEIISDDIDSTGKPETIDRFIDNEGHRVWKLRLGKLNITATYLNEPSESVLDKCNQTYNRYFHDFNK
ncbi:hypothetical protein [Paenibacillus sp. SYP-B3998]|uniref:hypothetical protein n=1 Tax=Paenibacillus sp. SYP-B3998 TaxID=2678564 RepID=UPI0013CF9FFE|nr:hypothetical protein [Paenibacillus sp. SYP-B3998]